jgi:hypothetical protein
VSVRARVERNIVFSLKQEYSVSVRARVKRNIDFSLKQEYSVSVRARAEEGQSECESESGKEYCFFFKTRIQSECGSESGRRSE